MTIETIAFRNVVSVLLHPSRIKHLHNRPDQQRGSQKTKRGEVLPGENCQNRVGSVLRLSHRRAAAATSKDIVHANGISVAKYRTPLRYYFNDR
jgi:hypothetical protein